jgi:hypothetical protein
VVVVVATEVRALSFHVRRFVLSCGLLLALWFVPTSALAAGEDSAVTGIVDSVLSEEYASGSFGVAQTKLNDALARCIRKGCTGGTKAQVYVALGMVASQLGKAEDAKTQFAAALQADPNAKLPDKGQTPNIKSQWAEANKSSGGASAAAGGGEEPGVVPAGWNSKEAYDLAMAATKAQEASKYAECIEKDNASLAIDEQPRTRLHLASCEYRSGKLIDALRNSKKALELGIQKRDAAVMKVARERVNQLIERIPKITFVPPSGVNGLTVKFDDRPVPTESLTKRFPIDPGKHVVTAEGTVNGYPSEFREEYDVKESDVVTVKIKLEPREGALTRPQLDCLAKVSKEKPADEIQEEIKKCIGENKRNIVIKMGGDINGYTDTTAVQVFSPGINASVVSPTSGWNVGGSYLIDIVSAASPDIVSYASPPFREIRHAGSITGGYKPKLIGIQGFGNVSSEPDYLSITGGVSGSWDLNDKLTTPRLGISHTRDTIGKGQTPFSVYSKDFYYTTFDLGLTQVMSPTTVLQFGLTASFERGDQSKPYRHVPMFDPQIAGRVRPGATIRLSDTNRLQFRPLEQLPTERDRYALALRLIKRLGVSTLRLEQRFYIDTWGIKSTTTDGRFMIDIDKRIRVWPHVRINAQTGADFHKLAYSATTLPNGQVVLPLYRTGDRENAPMGTVTAGGGMRYGIGNLDGETKAGLTFALDIMYSRFFDSLYILQRTAAYATLAFDVEF